MSVFESAHVCVYLCVFVFKYMCLSAYVCLLCVRVSVFVFERAYVCAEGWCLYVWQFVYVCLSLCFVMCN